MRQISRTLLGRLFTLSWRRNRTSFIILLFSTFAMIFLLELLVKELQSLFDKPFDFFHLFLLWLPLPWSPSISIEDSLPYIAGGGLISLILLLRWIQICLAVQRLHDLGRHGFLVVFLLVPGVNFMLLFVLALWPGNKKRNRYGAPPRKIDLIIES